jgi:glutamyl-tRNA reductase
MHLTMVGLSHKTAPIEIREKLTFPANRQQEALSLLTASDEVVEAVILSTCNRTEIYAVTHGEEAGADAVIDFMCDYHDLDRHELIRYLYMEGGGAVVRHLFRVVASLDSMVIGEAQILGQVKDAYDHAFQHQAVGRVFNKLFRLSFEVGKRVRTETEIGESAVSISYAAIELAKKVFDSLAGKTILIVGAGKMSELTAKHLVANGVKSVLVANRTYDRALELARRFDGRPIPYEELFDHMRDADIVVSSTSAPGYVIEKEDVARAMKGRGPRPLFLIDIALPRDISPHVNELSNVFLYDIDDLNGVVESNLEERMREARRAEVIIEEELGHFDDWLESMEVVPTVAAMRAKAEAIRQAELARALKRLDGLSEKELKTVEMLTEAIVNKMLHAPTARLKEIAGERYGVGYIEAVRYLYELDQSEGKQSPGMRLRDLLGGKASAKKEIGENLG